MEAWLERDWCDGGVRWGCWADAEGGGRQRLCLMRGSKGWKFVGIGIELIWVWIGSRRVEEKTDPVQSKKEVR